MALRPAGERSTALWGLLLMLASCGRTPLDGGPMSGETPHVELDGEPSGDASLGDAPDASLGDASDASLRDATCRPTLEVEHRWPHGSPAVFAPSRFVASPPLWVDLDRDGEREIALVAGDNRLQDGVLRVLDGDRVYSSATNELSGLDQLAAGDLDGDGDLELVAVREGWGLLAYDHHAQELWFSPSPPPPPPFGPMEYRHRIGGAALLADLDGDGDDEVLFGGVVLDGGNGELLWSADVPAGWAGTNFNVGPLACVGNLMGDAHLEVVFGRQVYDWQGALQWEHGVRDGFCGVSDLDGDGSLEVVLVAESDVSVLAGRTGGRLARFGVGGRRGAAGGPPTIANVFGDSAPELIVADAEQIRVFDPLCDGCDALFHFRFGVPTHRMGGAGPTQAVFAFDDGNDGLYELLVQTGSAIMVLRQSTIAAIALAESQGPINMPVPVDLDGDGNVELLAGSAAYTRGSSSDMTGLLVLRQTCTPLRADLSDRVDSAPVTVRAVPAM